MAKTFEQKKLQFSDDGFIDIKPSSIKKKSFVTPGGKEKIQITYKIVGREFKGYGEESTLRCLSSSTETFQDTQENQKVVEERVLRLKALESGLEDVVKDDRGISQFSEPPISFYLKRFYEDKLNEYIIKKNYSKEKAEKLSRMSLYRKFIERTELFLSSQTPPIQFFSQLEGNFRTMTGYGDFLLSKKIASQKNGEGEDIEPERTLGFSTVKEYVKLFKSLVDDVNLKLQPQEKRVRDFFELKNFDKEAKAHRKNVGNRLEQKKRAITDAEAKKVFEKISLFFAAPFAVSLLSGIRRNKVVRLVDDEVDLKNNIFNLYDFEIVNFKGVDYEVSQKTNESLVVPISNELSKILKVHYEYKEKWQEENGIETPFVFFNAFNTKKNNPKKGHPKRGDAYLDKFYEACDLCKIDRTELNIQALRISTSMNMFDQFIKSALQDSKEMLGHKDVRITKTHYFDLGSSQIKKLQKAVNAMPIGLKAEVLKSRYENFRPDKIGSIIV